MSNSMNALPISLAAPMGRRMRPSPSCPVALRDAFERLGWRAGVALESLPNGMTFAVVAQCSAGRRASDEKTALVFFSEGDNDIRVADVWRLIDEMQAVRPDTAALCLGRGARISPRAAEAAARFDVAVYRIAA